MSASVRKSLSGFHLTRIAELRSSTTATRQSEAPGPAVRDVKRLRRRSQRYACHLCAIRSSTRNEAALSPIKNGDPILANSDSWKSSNGLFHPYKRASRRYAPGFRLAANTSESKLKEPLATWPGLSSNASFLIRSETLIRSIGLGPKHDPPKPGS